MDLDVTRLKQNAQARLKSLYIHGDQLVNGNVKKREKQIERSETKETKTVATSNKSSCTITISTQGQKKGEALSTATVPINPGTRERRSFINCHCGYQKDLK